MVELLVANEKVAGSNLVSRSNFLKRIALGAVLLLSCCRTVPNLSDRRSGITQSTDAIGPREVNATRGRLSRQTL